MSLSRQFIAKILKLLGIEDQICRVDLVTRSSALVISSTGTRRSISQRRSFWLSGKAHGDGRGQNGNDRSDSRHGQVPALEEAIDQRGDEQKHHHQNDDNHPVSMGVNKMSEKPRLLTISLTP